MEPTDKTPVAQERSGRDSQALLKKTINEFLPDAEEIERRPFPSGVRYTLYALVLFVLCAILWASLSQIDRIVVARGKLVTPLPNIVVQPLETGIIRSIDVRVGQTVRRGEKLATLDPTFTTADAAQLRTQRQSLLTQIRRLEAELGKSGSLNTISKNPEELLQAKLYEERGANYRARMTQLSENVDKITAAQETNRRDQNALGSRVESLKEIEGMHLALQEKQFVSRLKYLETRDKRLEIDRDLQLAINRAQEIQKERAAAEAEKTAFSKEWRQKALEEMVTARRELNGVIEQLSKAERRNELVIMTTPVDAVVLEIAKKSVASVAQAAEPLFTLVPIDAPLEAEVQIEADDIGNVRVGDKVHIKVDAFPFQKHGTISGTVRIISEDSFARERTPLNAKNRSEAYYLGRIVLDPVKFEAVPKDTRLLPGMTLTGEVVVGRRSIISYFLYPIIRAFDEAIREP